MDGLLDASGISSAGAQGTNFLSGTLKDFAGMASNLYNIKQQADTQHYQKQLQQTMFQREDNATQRRAADLRAAGLSPTLAAGSAAGAGAPIQITTPHSEAPAQHDYVPDMSNILKLKQNALTQEADISHTHAQDKLIQLQIENAKQDVIGHKLDNIEKAHSADITTHTGIGKEGGELTNLSRALLGPIVGFAHKIFRR